ncbi:MAG: AMP-dependent synthetase/ligase [Planctomycetia bacterium]|nr:AMP-dependent synthetase/ligase [Planctomycetia bacterium]
MNNRNLAELLPRHAERIGSQVAVRFKRDGRYQDLTWTEYWTNVLACAAALADVGIKLGDRVGLLGENRVEWLIADMGILTAGAVTVSPHASLSARQIHYQMKDAGVRWLFVSTAAQLEKVRQVRAELPELEGVVVFDTTAAGSDAISWHEFLQRGRQSLPRLSAEMTQRGKALGPENLATIMYTSGTTGEPKGVMLTHANILSNVAACLEAEPSRPDDVKLCWLPLSHIYARTVDHYERLFAGLLLCLAESVETLVANLAEIQPTQFSSVPRFYEKVLSTIASPDPAVVSARLRSVFGPRIRCMGAGGAPLPPAIETTLRAAGLPILPGYGLTESSPVITFNLTTRNKPYTVGVALPGVEVKIAPDGEILTRGPHVMKGYWNKPEATAEAIRDGWLYTGDLGALDSDGFLTITGRKKELLVLSNGKKVVPPQIEGLLVADECIDQAVVYGEGRNYLTALLVPHWDNLRRAIADCGLQIADSEDALTRHPAVYEVLRKRVCACLVDVASYEQVKKFIVLPRPFTVAADELTVSLKTRRGIIFAKYKAELDALYRGDPNAECGIRNTQ